MARVLTFLFFWAEEGEKQMQIKILATSDMYGYIMPTSYSEKDGFAFGTAKAATMLKSYVRLPKDQFSN